MPWPHLSSLPMKMSPMKRLTMMMMIILMVWTSTPYIHVCQAAGIPVSDPSADSSHSGSEPLPSGSGQSTPFLHTPAESGDPMDGSSSSSGAEAGLGMHVHTSARSVEEGGEQESLSKAEVFSGETLAQDDLTMDPSVTVTFDTTEDGKGLVHHRVTDKLDDDTAPSGFSGGPALPSSQPAGPARGKEDSGNKRNERSSSRAPQDYSSPFENGNDQEANRTEDSAMTNYTATAPGHLPSHKVPGITHEAHTLSSVDVGEKLPVKEINDLGTIPSQTIQPQTNPASSAEHSPANKGTTERNRMNTPLIYANTSTAINDTVSQGHAVTKPDDFSIPDKDWMSTTTTSDKQVTALSPTNTNIYTPSRAPADHSTTGEEIFTTPVETSRTPKSGPTFKVTSDVSGTRTRRQTHVANGQTMQHTTADFSSTVPSNADSTSAMRSTLVPTSESSSEPTDNDTSSESPTTVTTLPTTSASTEMPQTSTSANVGMRCGWDQDCGGVNNSQCTDGLCSCRTGYHSDRRNESCLQEPYGLNVTANDRKRCVDITWSGGGVQYNVTVTSSVANDVERLILREENNAKACNFSPGANLTVSVALSEGGRPVTKWTVLKPMKPALGEISFVNETCFTAEWVPAEGYVEFYKMEVLMIVDSNLSTVIERTNATGKTVCHLQPGTQFSLKVYSSSHGNTSTGYQFVGPDSTVPSQPLDGWAERNQLQSTTCVDLKWTPGPGDQDNFTVIGPVTNNTIRSNNSMYCGLLPSSRYLFGIAAYSTPRYSEPLMVEACTDPQAVHDLRVEQVDATWVTLSWTLPTPQRSDPAALPDHYVVRGNHSMDPIKVLRNRESITVSGLSPGTTYSFSVTAEFCNRTSLASSVTARTNFSVLTSVEALAEGRELRVSWEFDQDRNMSVELTVKYRGDIVYSHVVLTSPHSVTTNHSGACYTISLRVVNSTRVSTIPKATDPEAPEEVRDLHAYRLTNNRQEINVTWSPPAVTNGLIAFYNVSVRGLRGFQHISQNKDCEHHGDLDCHDSKTTQAMILFEEESTSYSLVVDQLSEYENYNVSVTAFTSGGGGPSTSFLVGDQLLDSVGDLTVDAPNASCLSLAWSYPANAPDHLHDQVHFLVQYQEEDEGSKSEVSPVSPVAKLNVSEPRVLLCQLRYWTLYRVNVTAADRQGPGRISSLRNRTDEHVPGEVSNLSVSMETSISKERSMEVTWSPPVHPYGFVHSYYVVVRDTNTSEVIERRTDPSQPRLKRTVDGRRFGETFQLIGDHLYNVQVFAATRAGNGSKVNMSHLMPAGALPASGDRVKLNSHDVGVTSVLVHVPTSLLCDFGYGLPHHAGYIVHRPGWTPIGIGRGVSIGPSPVVTTPWTPAHTPFFVQLDVRKLCISATHGGFLTVRVGDKECRSSRQGGGGRKTALGSCSGPLEPSTGYQLLVVFCTSAACRYSQHPASFTTQSQPEDGDVTGLAAGLTVVFLLLLLGAAFASYWYYKKKYRRIEEPVITLQPTEREEREAICKTRPVSLDCFVDHVQLLHKDSNLGFSDEYKTIKDHAPSYSARAAELPPCKPKNRYMNILPFDRSRVKLIPTDDEEGSDYINASYLPGENHQREFIAAQGPLPSTVDDFWRMVWENRVCVIVMLTQCIEKGKTKCDKYWPDEGVQTIYGDLVVQVRSQSVLPDYIIRVIDVKLGNQSRMIKHFHFMRWPDHGCPEHTSMLLNFVSSVRAHMPHSGAGPTLVHCSAGVGRTGTFIALDRLLLQIRQRSHVDIFNLVFTMREHRIQMVQTENQYVYIHDCLADALTKDKESDDDQSDDDEDEHIYGNC